jgi:hypothetical protein
MGEIVKFWSMACLIVLAIMAIVSVAMAMGMGGII